MKNHIDHQAILDLGIKKGVSIRIRTDLIDKIKNDFGTLQKFIDHCIAQIYLNHDEVENEDN